ncbi:succinylornithine transaminase, also has acetylornitine transaminase activity, PLP-dependent [Cupriavidus taiwanensis]|uniref:acetylornithine transaminase n=1 Tax=Cupriavidus taiwanensis TaxID=164546 RepID=UPI000E16E23E|nr:acetylornithine transaminase [Cupriavidus taiwanensis]SPA26516.1 succinylornithine transaminase, also has acetylornitine transaminase activity, PLP-dependent [Cupriavidus taiwanensis]
MAFAEYPVQSLMYITNRPELVFTEGKGSWLTDHNGKRYLDFVQGWAVNCLGHSNQGMIDALVAQSHKLINPSPAFYNEPMLKLAKQLTDHSCFDKVFFANSGAEANEGAIKLARKWGRKHKDGAFEIITMDHSFHGRTLATMSASGKAGWDTIFAPQVPGFPRAELNDLASVEQLITDNTVGIMLEPVQGEGGVIPATREFMQGLRALADKHKLLLIVDEVQAGCGRCGTLFAYELAGVEPDIMTLGKGIGGGVPLSALLCKAEVASFEAGDQGGTYNGNPLMTAVGSAVIEQLTAPGFLDEVKAKGDYLKEQLLALSAEFGLGGERGEGLLRALLLGKDIGPQLVEEARDMAPQGLLLNAPRANLLRFMPALNVTREEIDQMIGMLRTLLKKLA